MKRIIPLRTAALVAAFALIAGCGSTGTTHRAAPTTKPVTEPHYADPSAITGTDDISISMGSIIDEKRHIHAQWPQIPGAKPLSDAISTQLHKDVADFGPGSEAAELTVAWRLLGSGPDAIGIATDETFNPGASVARIWHSYWYDVQSGAVVDNNTLAANPDDLVDKVRSTLSKRKGVDKELLDEALANPIPMVGFTKDGGLFVGFSAYEVAAGSEGEVTMTIPRSQTDKLLSDFGKRARQAALEPTAPRIAVPAPEPTPTLQEPAPVATDAVDCKVAKCVAITYDDGPGGETAKLLKTLADKKAVATFFMLGQQVATYPHVVKQAAQGGNEIGVHTWDHKSLPNLAPAQMRSEIQRTVDILTKTMGKKPTLMRPPYGASNETVRAQERAAGLAEIMWSVDTLDWKDRNTALVTQRVLNQTRRGSIVLMHDIHPTTVAAAPAIIDGLRQRGFTLVTVSQLIGQPQPGVKYSQVH